MRTHVKLPLLPIDQPADVLLLKSKTVMAPGTSGGDGGGGGVGGAGGGAGGGLGGDGGGKGGTNEHRTVTRAIAALPL